MLPGSITIVDPYLALATHVNQTSDATTAGAEFLDPAMIRSIQADRWLEQSAYVQECSGFYKQLYGAFHDIPDELERLVDLPFTDK